MFFASENSFQSSWMDSLKWPVIDRDTNGEIPRDGNGNRLSRCAQRAQGQPSRLLAPVWRSAGAEHGCSGDSGHMVSAPSGQLALFPDTRDSERCWPNYFLEQRGVLCPLTAHPQSCPSVGAGEPWVTVKCPDYSWWLLSDIVSLANEKMSVLVLKL